MRVLVVLALFLAVISAQRRGPPPHAGPKHGGPHGPQVVCDDGSDATCECATKPCGPGGNIPDCSCADGSSPSIKPPCADGSFPSCPGACEDGSDPNLGVFGVQPCGDGSRPNMRLCKCADGTELKPPGGGRGGRSGGARGKGGNKE